MKFLRCFIAAIILVISGNVMAQSQRELGQLMRERGEYYFTLSVDDPSEIRDLSKICSIDGTDGRHVVAYANQQEYEMLIKAGYQPELQTPPSLRANVTMWNGQGTYNWDSYLTYPQYVSMMEEFPSKAIDGRTCTLFSLGTLTTSNHRQLLGVRINNGSPAGKPKFLYSSTMHGDEITGMILMLRLINELCTSTDTQVVNLINNLDIYILPLTNPDGTYNGGNSTVNSAIRYNGYNKDLNRNYKDYFEGDHPDGESYQDETLWTMAFADSLLFTMGGNYHGGAEVMNYPWDPVYTDHADVDWYEYVCTKYVQVARQTYSSYMSDTYSDGVTNGATWYTISGSRQDYMNAFAQCREVTVECSSTKTPSASQLPSYWNYNRKAMLAFMEEALYGVHGFVYDAVTEESLQGVTVTVENHDVNNSYVTTHSIGDFHRPIKGGTYTFTFSKQGYHSQSVQVTVADGETLNLTIYLEPDLDLAIGFTASNTNASLGESISFTDTSSGMISSWSWTFEGATPSTSTEQNPTGITYNTPGDYDVTLVITGPTGLTDSLTKENYIHVSESMLVGDGGTATHSYLPSYNYYNYTLTEQIYTPADLGEGGIITSIAFYNGGSAKTRNYDFYMKSTTKSTFTGPADWIAVEASDKVFSGNVTMTANDWTVISLSTPFLYDGVTNVVLVADDNTGSYTNSPHMACRVFNAQSQALYIYNDNTNFDPLSPPTSSSSNNAVLTVKNQLLITKDPFPTTPFNITVSANPSRAGSATGSGEYMFGETCTVIATPNEGYSFTGWTENGTVVSEDLEYSFVASADRDLVANFTFAAMVSGNCYYSVDNMSAGSYVVGYLDGATLNMISQNNTSVAATSATVTPTDYGFSVDEGTNFSQVTLQAYGNNGQYYIKSGNYYLIRSSSNYGGNSSLTWSTSSSSSGRWYINANGVYVAVTSGWGGSATNYYLYYNNGSFQVSTSQNNNIVFYTEGNCPTSEFAITATVNPAEAGSVEGADVYFEGETCTLTATANEGYTFVNWTENGEEVSADAIYSFEVTGERALVANFEEEVAAEQITILSPGWNWFVPTVEITLEELEAALGTNGITIKTQTQSVGYEDDEWMGDDIVLVPGQMYKIEVSTTCEIVLQGNPAQNVTITIYPGHNWIGYIGSQAISIEEAFSNFDAFEGDIVKSLDDSSSYEDGEWMGDVEEIQPGVGYIYISRDTVSKELVFPTNK